MRTRWRKVFRAMLGLLLLLLLAVLVEHLRGRAALAREIAALRARGEKLTVAELTPPRPPAESNGAPAFLAAMACLPSTNDALSWAPLGWKFVAPGKVWRFTQREGWSQKRQFAQSKPTDAKTLTDWTTQDDLGDVLQRAQPELNELRASLRQPGFDFGTTYSLKNFYMPRLVTIKNAGKWLAAAGLTSLRQGDLDTALTNLEFLAAYSSKVMREPLLISQLVAYTIPQGYGYPITWEALQTSGWNDAQLARMQAAWASLNYVQPLIPALGMERAMGGELFDDLSLANAKMLVGEPFGNWGHSQTWSSDPSWLDALTDKQLTGIWYGVYLPLWRAAWADQDHERLMEIYQKGLDGSRLMTNWHNWPQTKIVPPSANEDFWPVFNQAPEMGFYDRCRFPASAQVSGTAARCLLKAVNLEILRNLTLTAVALQRHQLRHGKFPDSLQALVPAFLPSVPTDEMDGQPLRYKLKTDGSFLLYSVGENGVDDGGDPAPMEGDNFRNLLRDRDIVWPVPATREEITAADDKKNSR